MKLQFVFSLALCLTGISDVAAELSKHKHHHKSGPSATGQSASKDGQPAKNNSATNYHVIKQAIVVGKGQTFDCHGDTYDRGESCNNQSETGKAEAVFEVYPGGTLKNCIIGPNQSQGVRCEYGSCTFENIQFPDVCEDAITIKGNDEGETSYVLNSRFAGAVDKAVQFNGCGKLVVDNCHFSNTMKAVRSCGDCDYNSEKCSRHITVTNSVFEHVGTVVAINDNFADTATISGNQFSAVQKVCESYKGVTSRSQKPTDIGHCGANAKLSSNVNMR